MAEGESGAARYRKWPKKGEKDGRAVQILEAEAEAESGENQCKEYARTAEGEGRAVQRCHNYLVHRPLLVHHILQLSQTIHTRLQKLVHFGAKHASHLP